MSQPPLPSASDQLLLMSPSTSVSAISLMFWRRITPAFSLCIIRWLPADFLEHFNLVQCSIDYSLNKEIAFCSFRIFSYKDTIANNFWSRSQCVIFSNASKVCSFFSFILWHKPSSLVLLPTPKFLTNQISPVFLFGVLLPEEWAIGLNKHRFFERNLLVQ